MTPSPMTSLIAQLQAAARNGKERPAQSFNPHPKGKMIPGSVTEKVYKWLLLQPGWVTTKEVIDGTECSIRSVSWALMVLRNFKLVQTAGDQRNSRYMRYRIKP